MASVRPRLLMRALVVLVACAGAMRAMGCADPYDARDEPALAQPDAEAGDSSDAAPAIDAGDAADASGPSDAAADVRNPCDARAPFTEIVPIAALSTGGDETVAQLRQDESLAYIARGANVAFYARQPNGGWDGGAGVEINAGNADNPRMMDDLLTVYYSVYLGGTVGAARIFVAARPTTSGTFGSGDQLQLGAMPGESDSEPFVLPGQQAVYFTSTRTALGQRQLWFTRRAGASSWMAPIAVPGVSSAGAAGNDRRPVLSADERVIYFGSDRIAGQKSTIFVGTRADVMQPFQVTQPTELASSDDEYPTWVSPDLCRLYFASDRGGGFGQRDIWLASRKP